MLPLPLAFVGETKSPRSHSWDRACTRRSASLVSAGMCRRTGAGRHRPRSGTLAARRARPGGARHPQAGPTREGRGGLSPDANPTDPTQAAVGVPPAYRDVGFSVARSGEEFIRRLHGATGVKPRPSAAVAARGLTPPTPTKHGLGSAVSEAVDGSAAEDQAELPPSAECGRLTYSW